MDFKTCKLYLFIIQINTLYKTFPEGGSLSPLAFPLDPIRLHITILIDMYEIGAQPSFQHIIII